MKITGIVRRIDDLGRIVIPKELRRTLRLQEGDALEFLVEGNMVALRKYAPIEDNELIKVFSVVELAAQAAGSPIAVYDSDGHLVKATDDTPFAPRLQDDAHSDQQAVYVPSTKALGCYLVGDSVPALAVSIAELYLDK